MHLATLNRIFNMEIWAQLAEHSRNGHGSFSPSRMSFAADQYSVAQLRQVTIHECRLKHVV